MEKGKPVKGKKVKAGPGRKPYVVDWAIVDSYLEAHCTGTQIASILGICADTLYIRCAEEKKMVFTDYMLLKRDKGKSHLKHKQYTLALEGDRGMLIWLGKNWLEQKDNHDLNVTGAMNIGVVNFGDDPNPKPYAVTKESDDEPK